MSKSIIFYALIDLELKKQRLQKLEIFENVISITYRVGRKKCFLIINVPLSIETCDGQNIKIIRNIFHIRLKMVNFVSQLNSCTDTYMF